MEKGERHDICPLASARARAERQRVDAHRSIFPTLKFGQRDLRGRQEAPAKPQFLSYFMHATFLDIFPEGREQSWSSSAIAEHEISLPRNNTAADPVPLPPPSFLPALLFPSPFIAQSQNSSAQHMSYSRGCLTYNERRISGAGAAAQHVPSLLTTH